MSFIAHDRIVDICPVCEQEGVMETGRQIETLKIRGKAIKINAYLERCTVCREVFATVEDEEKNIQKAYRLYRQEVNLLQPDEIREIRMKYGLSQKAFARLLGWGEITLHRYESGALQDEVHNDLLLLLDKPDNFSTIFEKNRSRMTRKQVQKIQEKLSELLVLVRPMVTATSTLITSISSGFVWNEWPRFLEQTRDLHEGPTGQTKDDDLSETEDSPLLSLVA